VGDRLVYRFSRRQRGPAVNGWQQRLEGAKTLGNLSLRGDAFLLRSEKENHTSEWTRLQATASYRTRLLTPGYVFSLDKNRLVSRHAADSVAGSAVHFEENRVFLRTADSLKTRWGRRLQHPAGLRAAGGPDGQEHPGPHGDHGPPDPLRRRRPERDGHLPDAAPPAPHASTAHRRDDDGPPRLERQLAGPHGAFRTHLRRRHRPRTAPRIRVPARAHRRRHPRLARRQRRRQSSN
jgi:hypothetical protein